MDYTTRARANKTRKRRYKAVQEDKGHKVIQGDKGHKGVQGDRGH